LGKETLTTYSICASATPAKAAPAAKEVNFIFIVIDLVGVVV
jgi:hypothetical protein